ncbi:hypothetical protein CEXT_724481 [Caerostris extrusa]|uniref:Uncharacterized protein n=1 Tax=Caerostris extrusa TaxID=172846 RepID=A0AAV4QNS3_CAEEX|nr:hypothetical protein CEXT_724481 [Caerostris extrusa]
MSYSYTEILLVSQKLHITLPLPISEIANGPEKSMNIPEFGRKDPKSRRVGELHIELYVLFLLLSFLKPTIVVRVGIYQRHDGV